LEKIAAVMLVERIFCLVSRLD